MKIGFIGAGNMGSALATAVSKSAGTEIFVYDKCKERIELATAAFGGTYMSAEDIASKCDFVFLGVKPNIIPAVATEIKSFLSARTVVVSMAAGVSIEKLEALLGKNVPIIRIMPNTPASIGEGMILWCANEGVSDRIADSFLTVLGPAGMFSRIDEKKIDAASALSGCGPAFVYMFIEALADGAVQCGLTREDALLYASQTLIGAARLAAESGVHPEKLKDMVCSPGGSTIAGVHALEEGKFRATCANAIISAYKRTLELGK